MIVAQYLSWKDQWSQARYRQEAKPEATFPSHVLASAEALVGYLSTIPYTGDGARVMWHAGLGRWIGWGFPDLYTNPWVILAAMHQGRAEAEEIDCDDIAVLACLGLKLMGQNKSYAMRPVNVRLVTLVSGAVQFMWAFPWVYWPSHVVCLFERMDWNLGRLRTGMIDTNGLEWFDTEAEAVAKAGERYGTQYTPYVTPMPFGL